MHEELRKKTSLTKYIPLNLFVSFACERCWRPNINFIFLPLCYDRHVVSCSPDVGVHSIRAFRGPPRSGVAFPTTSRLYCLEFDTTNVFGYFYDIMKIVKYKLPN